MGRKAKRARLSARIARLTGEQETASRPTLVENSQKIEELKIKNPEPVIEEPVTLEEPKFMTEAEPVKVEEKEAPKVQVKKTTKKRTPRKTTTRAKKMNTKSKSKSISSKQ
tara:strand:- start:712 stop:1044 length:333 start_codon:yes stop_codon:yes gene_type:complete